MNRRFVPTLALLIGCWLLSAAGTAEAGFIAASVDRDASALAGTSSMAPSDDTPGRRLPIAEQLERQAALASPFAPASTGSAGAPVTSASSSGPPVADLPPVAVTPPSGLVTRLAVDRDEWLPPPFLSGIFRPPRFVG
jgi:hypothetical protein